MYVCMYVCICPHSPYTALLGLSVAYAMADSFALLHMRCALGASSRAHRPQSLRIGWRWVGGHALGGGGRSARVLQP
jgi:hypothetical protein